MNRVLLHKTPSEAMEYIFVCPGCKGYHSIPTKGPKAWGFNGSLEKPTFTPSLLCWTDEWTDPEDPSFTIPKTVCHSFITDGEIKFLGDCTHELAGQIVDLPEMYHR